MLCSRRSVAPFQFQRQLAFIEDFARERHLGSVERLGQKVNGAEGWRTIRRHIGSGLAMTQIFVLEPRRGLHLCSAPSRRC